MGIRFTINRTQMDALKKLVRSKVKNQVVDAIARDARRYAPVDSGALRRSIAVSKAGTNSWRVTAGGGPVNYAVFVELGHEVVYRSREGRLVHTGRHVPPQPFLRPALYQRRSIS